MVHRPSSAWLATDRCLRGLRRSLVGYSQPDTPAQTVNYIGSKYSLLDFLERGILERMDPTGKTMLDVFAGTGIVGWHFKQKGFRVLANDIQYYAYCLNRALVQVNRPPTFPGLAGDLGFRRSGAVEAVLGTLNDLAGIDGFVYRTYCPGGTRGSHHRRQYFTDDNGRRCDAIRKRIKDWREESKLTEDEYFYLLASLIEAVDRVANTASVYGAFLKHIKKSALRSLRLEPLPVARSRLAHRAYNCDGRDLVGRVKHDVLYMDPPYNHRQYCANYHVLETIARYDRPEIRGVTGLRPNEDQKSDFCNRRRALQALGDMVRETRARYVFLSYNSEGLMERDDILSTMGEHGDVDLLTRDYARFRADVDRENRVYKADRVDEYLFCLEKDG